MGHGPQPKMERLTSRLRHRMPLNWVKKTLADVQDARIEPSILKDVPCRSLAKQKFREKIVHTRSVRARLASSLLSTCMSVVLRTYLARKGHLTGGKCLKNVELSAGGATAYMIPTNKLGGRNCPSLKIFFFLTNVGYQVR